MATEPFDTAISDFSHSIGLLVRRARTAASSHELSWTETSVLRRLARSGPATTAELARTQGMRPQSMRTVIASLEKLGMIARKPHDTDRRQVNLVLTGLGAAEQQSAGDAKRTWLSQAFAKLNEHERAVLLEAGAIIRCLVESDPQ